MAPQGFAFLEFDSAPALEKALRCHHTLLLKRKINVELTAGGGGKSENRMEKIKKRNEGLEVERKKRMEEAKMEKKEKPAERIHPDRLKGCKFGHNKGKQIP
jgi:nucleolar protein 6